MERRSSSSPGKAILLIFFKEYQAESDTSHLNPLYKKLMQNDRERDCPFYFTQYFLSGSPAIIIMMMVISLVRLEMKRKRSLRPEIIIRRSRGISTTCVLMIPFFFDFDVS